MRCQSRQGQEVVDPMRRVTVLLAVTIAGVLAVAGCSDGQAARPAAIPAGFGGEASDFYEFDQLRDLVATSDAVVIATAESEQDGRSVGDPGSLIHHRQVTFRVERVLFGDVDGETVDVETVSGLEADGYKLPPPAEYVQFHPGQRSLLFLWRHDDAKTVDDKTLYTYLNSQGAYEINGEDIVDLPNHDDPLVRRIQRMSVREATERIGEARAAVQRGELRGHPRP